MATAWTIGEIARMFSISADSVRAYEKLGVIAPARVGERRVFTECEVNAIAAHRKALAAKRGVGRAVRVEIAREA